MTVQSFNIGSADNTTSLTVGWVLGGDGHLVNSALVTSSPTYLNTLQLTLPFGPGDPTVSLRLDSTDSLGDFATRNFTSAVRNGGTLRLTAGSLSLVLAGISDSSEPYFWTPSNGSAITAFVNGYSGQSATLRIDDNVVVNPDTAPARPVAPTVTALTSSSIRAVGVAPDDGGSPITSYDWEYHLANDNNFHFRENETSLVQTFTGLAASTEYEVSFRATNSIGDSAFSLDGSATTLSSNTRPTVVIHTSYQTVDGGTVVALSATATDPGGFIASYRWTGDGVFADDEVEDTNWTAPSSREVDRGYTLRLTVTDNEGLTASDSIIITVRGSLDKLFGGAENVDALYGGTDTVDRVYLGSTLVYGVEP